MKTLNDLLTSECLPADWRAATLVGRAWLPGAPAGPSPIALRPNGDVVDLASVEPSMSQLLARTDRVALARAVPGKVIGTAEALLADSGDGRNAGRPSLLAPSDLQVIKATGVTFVQSLLERVIEEQARGDTGKAEAIRVQVTRIMGDNLAPVKDRGAPGMGFTHKVGDLVSISTPKLGRLANRVTTSDKAAPWTFGISALMRNLGARGLRR